MAKDTSGDRKPAPEAARCEAGGGSCGAGQPLYLSDNGLVYCDHHAGWPSSREGRLEAGTRELKKTVGE